MSTPAAAAPPTTYSRVGDLDARIVHEVMIAQESVRSGLTFAFAGILALTILASFIGLWFLGGWDGIKDWLQVVLPAELALLGSAVGFYFGTQQS